MLSNQIIRKYTMELSVAAKLEGVLFYLTRPVSMEKLSSIVDVSVDSVREGVLELKEQLEGRGIVLVEDGDKVMLRVSPVLTPILDRYVKKEKESGLSKPALETLTIILYKERATKAEIDFIRGVNSKYIIRTLLVRGLITKKDNPNNSRAPHYAPTTETYSYLGLSSRKDLPAYQSVSETLDNYLSSED